MIGSVEVLEARTASALSARSMPARISAFSALVLEHRLDHQIAIGERREIGTDPDPASHRRGLLAAGAATADLLLHQRRRMRLALLRRQLLAVDQHHFDAGPGGRMGNPRSHESGTDDAETPHRFERRSLWPPHPRASAPME